MIQDDNSVLSKDCLNEFVIANFGQFQIAIPSGKKRVLRRLFSTQVSLPKRVYSSHGILLWKQHPAFSLSGLKLTSLFPESSPFSQLKRLSTGIPLSFEISSFAPLPEALIQQATLTCQIQSEDRVHYAIFRDIIPKFVHIVPNHGVLPLGQQVKDCLRKESKFVRTHWKTLQKNEFYRQYFSEPSSLP